MEIEWVDTQGWLLKPIPDQCVEDCSRPGRVDEEVSYWVNKLAFDIPDSVAARYLKDFGAWDAEELSDHDANNRRILWIACRDIAEQGEWLGAIH